MSRPLRHPRRGAVLALSAGAFFAVNGSVSKLTLGAGVEPVRLTALRCLGAFVVLAGVLAVTAPQRLRVGLREVPLLAAYGVIGVAVTQALFFVALTRLPVGVALLFEFTAPVWVALWVRFGRGEPVRRRLWAALGLALVGLALVARVLEGGTGLDGVGVAAGLGAAAALATFYVVGEHAVSSRDPISLTCWAMFAGAVFWSVAAPWWGFDAGVLADRQSLPGTAGAQSVDVPVWTLVLWVVLAGTVVPFALSIAALRHLPATTVGILAMVEPVLATAVAWVWLGEQLAAVQVAGAVVVVLGIVLAQTARRPARVVPVPPSTEVLTAG